MRYAEQDDVEAEVLLADADAVIRLTTAREQQNVYTLRNLAEDQAQQICDVVSFGSALALRVHVRSAQTPNGLVVLSSAIHPARLEPPDQAEFQSLAFRVLDGRAERPEAQAVLRSALADYRQALREAGDTVELCWRAVEALAYYFGRNNKVGMERLCQVLQFDRGDLFSTLEKSAAERRHGKAVWVTEAERLSALAVTRDAIIRFLRHVVPHEQTAVTVPSSTALATREGSSTHGDDR